MASEEKPSPDTAVKRRACDECRQRKLACSKTPDGCERCKRENIKCHYSEQKPMGRPRKRRMIEGAEDELAQEQFDGNNDRVLMPFSSDGFDFDAAFVRPCFPTGQPAAVLPNIEPEFLPIGTDDGNIKWHFGDLGMLASPPINFEDEMNQVPQHDLVPELSTPSSNSVTDETSPKSETTLAPCSCLASMYLSLASLQQFPTEIVTALKTVRSAAATAANSLWCTQCGSVLMGTPVLPIESFQNTMLLGTILPVIANGYNRLLKMIDSETDKAIAAGQMKTFRFLDYGGLCNRQSSIEQAMKCSEKELLYNAVEMPPTQWRTTVRALLRIDIYGHEQSGFKHKGLKDLIDEMEYRQRVRHEMIDTQIANGTLDPKTFTGFGLGHHSFYMDDTSKCLGERTKGCIEIIKMAKIAIDSLVIP